MKLNTTLTTWGLLTTMAAGGVVPALADGYRNQSGNQADKNNMRNLTIGAAAVAAYGLFSHNGAATLLGAAGAALAGSQYEKDRKQQSQGNNQYYYRDGRNGNSTYGRGGDEQNRNNGNWGNGNWDTGNRNNGDRDYDSRNGSNRFDNSRYNQDHNRVSNQGDSNFHRDWNRGNQGR